MSELYIVSKAGRLRSGSDNNWRRPLSTLDQQVREGDMFYLALETLKDKLPDLIG